MIEVKIGIREISYRVQGADFGNEEFKSRECSSTSRVYGSVTPQQRYNVGGYTALYGEVGGKKKSEFGEMGIRFAVGAVVGVLGGLALEKGVEYIEDRIVDDVVEIVEDDLSNDDDEAENFDDDVDYDDDVVEMFTTMMWRRMLRMILVMMMMMMILVVMTKMIPVLHLRGDSVALEFSS
ncbi:hypothetical protein P8452_50897 [Trifolium repens]|nr:hypothetical protein P8452_50897 [Trifolium repens]